MDREERLKTMRLLMDLEMSEVNKVEYEKLFKETIEQDNRLKEFLYNLPYYLQPDEED